jgi:hypothetical protein
MATDPRMLLATRLAASDALLSGLREAAHDAAYELLAARRGIGDTGELDPIDEARAAAVAAEAARLGWYAAAAAMLPLLERLIFLRPERP